MIILFFNAASTKYMIFIINFIKLLIIPANIISESINIPCIKKIISPEIFFATQNIKKLNKQKKPVKQHRIFSQNLLKNRYLYFRLRKQALINFLYRPNSQLPNPRFKKTTTIKAKNIFFPSIFNKFTQPAKAAEIKRGRKFLKKKNDNEQLTFRKSRIHKSKAFINIHVNEPDKPPFEIIFFINNYPPRSG